MDMLIGYGGFLKYMEVMRHERNYVFYATF